MGLDASSTPVFFFFLLLSPLASALEGLNGNAKVRGVNLGGWLVIEGWIKPSLFDSIPNPDMLDGTLVQFRSVTLQKYASADNGGGTSISVNRDTASSWETFTLWRVSEYSFQFRSSLGQFLTCHGDGCTVFATAESPATSETFFIERNNDRVHIKVSSGTYLQASEENQLTADYPGVPGWDDNAATFLMTIVANNLHGDYQLANSYGPTKAKDVLKAWNKYSSQNGMEHSASRDGSTGWPTTPDYISQTLVVIDFLAKRYTDHPAFLGIELLNEPSAAAVPLDTLVSYYKQGYEIVRKYSTTAYVIVCQRIGNADPLELYQANIGLHNIVVDLHFYNLFDPFFANMSSMDNIQFIYKSRESQLQALNSANGPLIFIGEWVNEWNARNRSQAEYQDFGKAQLDVYDAASFGWAYWTLKNAREHWDFEWNVKNNYLLLGRSPGRRSMYRTALFAAVVSCLFFQ